VQNVEEDLKNGKKNTCFVKISVQEEMSALEKQLEASQRFLGGVRSLASYEDIQQKQLRGLLIALGKSKDLSTSQAASFVEAIDSRLWSVAAVEELQRQVAAKTSQGEVDSERRRMQDFSQIIHFLAPDLATMILEGNAPADTVLRGLCLHAGRMSLRVPSEQTIATFVTLANWRWEYCNLLNRHREFLWCRRAAWLVRKLLQRWRQERAAVETVL
jgi:hypothetical protein